MKVRRRKVSSAIRDGFTRHREHRPRACGSKKQRGQVSQAGQHDGAQHTQDVAEPSPRCAERDPRSEIGEAEPNAETSFKAEPQCGLLPASETR